MDKKKKKGRAKEWLKENWQPLVFLGIYGGVLGVSAYKIHKHQKAQKELEAYWQTEEAWIQKAKEYEFCKKEAELMADFYKTSTDSLETHIE